MFWQEFYDEFKKDWYRIPNLITLIRLVFCFVPGLILVFGPDSFSMRLIAVSVLVFVALTDALDGYLARKFNQVTELGKILDPLVDKVFAGFTLISLSFVNQMAFLLLIFLAIKAISIGIRLASATKSGMKFSVGRIGKIDSVFVTITMGILFLPQTGLVCFIAKCAVCVTIVTSVMSWMDYSKRYPKNVDR
jgi:CDP-diacylglycerol--glycerol-3-phosphate 3-phosphatidyltransferase